MAMNPKNKNIKDLFPRTLVNINGEIYPPEAANISVFDRGFLYGDSVYEVTKTIKGKCLFLEEHLDRLYNSAELIAMPVLFTRAEIKKEIEKTVKALDVDQAYVRFVVTRGITPIGLDVQTEQNNMVIVVKEYPDYPAWWYEKGVSVCISSFLRNDPKATDPNAKSGNYLNNVLALLDARKKEFFDAVMTNKDGFITEGTTNNIWMIKNGEILTPPLKAGLLKGITRDKILDIMKKEKFKGGEKNFTPAEFLEADEAFFTSSTKGIVPICQINEKILQNTPGPITKKLMTSYEKLLKA
ncbi:MAG: aminotransferase class IV [Bacteriovoracaceae bacterium]|nr:aminotransferase class IV [Bacteriovoracaceae bacterium]